MPNKHPLMKLSHEEDLFLKHWIFDEFHYESGPGPAKRLQLEHRVVPAELSILIAAAIPDPADQKTAALGPPPVGVAKWPWTEEGFHARLAEARLALASQTHEKPGRMLSVGGSGHCSSV
jgi:hypothetical protein